MIGAGYTMTKTSSMVCLTFAVGIGGFAWAGFSVNHLDIAPQVFPALQHNVLSMLLPPFLHASFYTVPVVSRGFFYCKE